MIIYPENNYAIEVAENPHSNTFSIWFKKKPEDLVFHLLRAIGFRNRAYGKEFYHSNDVTARLFAEEIQQTLRQGCLPKVIPYISSHEQCESSITTNRFSIATIYYTNDEQKTVQQEFLMFENSRLIRESFAWLIGYLTYGTALNRIKTTEKVRKRDALRLFHDGNIKTKLPVPFGSGSQDEFSETETNADTIQKEEVKAETSETIEEEIGQAESEKKVNFDNIESDEIAPEITSETNDVSLGIIDSEEEIIEPENQVNKEEEEEVKQLPEHGMEVSKQPVLQTLENQEIASVSELYIDGIESWKEDEKEELLTNDLLQIPKVVIEEKLQAFDYKGKPIKVRQLKGYKLKLKSNAAPKIPLSSILISLKSIKVENNNNQGKIAFDNWIEASRFLTEWEVENSESKNELDVRIIWKNGVSFKTKISIGDLFPFSEKFAGLLGMLIYEKATYQLHKKMGLVGERIIGTKAEINLITELLDSSDFGFELKEFPFNLKPKIPVSKIEVKAGNAKEIRDEKLQEWQKFKAASNSLEFASTLVGIEKQVEIKVSWASAKSIKVTIPTIEIPAVISKDFWKSIIKRELKCSIRDSHQMDDDESTLPVNLFFSSASLEIYIDDFVSMCKRLPNDFYPKESESFKFSCNSIKYQLTTLFEKLSAENKLKCFQSIKEKCSLDSPINELTKLDYTIPFQNFIFHHFANLVFQTHLSYHDTQYVSLSETFSLIHSIIREVDYDVTCITELPPCIESEVQKYSNKAQRRLEKNELNEKIENEITTINRFNWEITAEHLNLLKSYSGYFDTDVFWVNPDTIFEYYTPDNIIKKMWELAYKFGFENGSVLEPAAGVGKFIELAPKGLDITACEVNEYAASICNLRNETAKVHYEKFQSLFYDDNNQKLKFFELPKYDLIIGSPPFLSNCCDSKICDCSRLQHVDCDKYFIKKGIDLLNQDGLLVFLIPHFFMSDNKHYKRIKKRIAKKAKLVTLYRLPEEVIPDLKINIDIVIYRKLRVS